jgi:predicted cupin superfamily sugar epimerase
VGDFGVAIWLIFGDYDSPGMWRRTRCIPASVRRNGAFSRKVRNSEELWLIYLGRVLVHVLDQDGGHQVLRVGTDLAAGERPVVTVPAGHWQAAEIPEGTPFAFGSNVCAPPFSWEEFALTGRALRRLALSKPIVSV